MNNQIIKEKIINFIMEYFDLRPSEAKRCFESFEKQINDIKQTCKTQEAIIPNSIKIDPKQDHAPFFGVLR